MNESYIQQPDKLIDLGFEKEESDSSSVRWVWFRKQILIGITDYYFEVVVTFDLSIDDNPKASYKDNRYYSYEGTKCFLKDINNDVIFETRFEFNTEKDLERLEFMFR